MQSSNTVKKIPEFIVKTKQNSNHKTYNAIPAL